MYVHLRSFPFASTAHWDLADPAQRYDSIIETVDGMNVADFIDPEIMQKLEELEAEEEARAEAGEYDTEEEDEDAKTTRARAAMFVSFAPHASLSLLSSSHTHTHVAPHRTAPHRVRQRRSIVQQMSRMRKSRNSGVLPRVLRDKGTVPGGIERLRAQQEADEEEDAMSMSGEEEDEGEDEDGERRRVRSRTPVRQKRREAKSRERSESVGPRARSRSKSHDAGITSSTMKKAAAKLSDLSQRERNYQGKQGEADRRYGAKMPKHLFSGKRSFKADRR